MWNPDKTGSNRHSSTSTVGTSHSSDSDCESDEDTDDVEAATVGDMNITVNVQFPTENFSSRQQRTLHSISDDSITDTFEVIDLDD
jgi:hypothetical protein